MRWQEISARYNNDEWLLVEALAARTENGERIFEDLVVHKPYTDAKVALQEYALTRRKYPKREFYVFQASNPAPSIDDMLTLWTMR